METTIRGLGFRVLFRVESSGFQVLSLLAVVMVAVAIRSTLEWQG